MIPPTHQQHPPFEIIESKDLPFNHNAMQATMLIIIILKTMC